MSDKRISSCPFCGGYAKLRRKNRTMVNGLVVRNTYVYCPTCDCRGGRVLYKECENYNLAEEKAIDVWNRRAK